MSVIDKIKVNDVSYNIGGYVISQSEPQGENRLPLWIRPLLNISSNTYSIDINTSNKTVMCLSGNDMNTLGYITYTQSGSGRGASISNVDDFPMMLSGKIPVISGQDYSVYDQNGFSSNKIPIGHYIGVVFTDNDDNIISKDIKLCSEATSLNQFGTIPENATYMRAAVWGTSLYEIDYDTEIAHLNAAPPIYDGWCLMCLTNNDYSIIAKSNDYKIIIE